MSYWRRQLNMSKIDCKHVTMERKIWPACTAVSSATNYQNVVEYGGQCSCSEQFLLQCPLTVDVCGGSGMTN